MNEEHRCCNCLRHHITNFRPYCTIRGRLSKELQYNGEYDDCSDYIGRTKIKLFSLQELKSSVPCWETDPNGVDFEISDSTAESIVKSLCKEFFDWKPADNPPQNGYCIMRTPSNDGTTYWYELGYYFTKAKKWFALGQSGRLHQATPSEWRPITWDIIL